MCEARDGADAIRERAAPRVCRRRRHRMLLGPAALLRPCCRTSRRRTLPRYKCQSITGLAHRHPLRCVPPVDARCRMEASPAGRKAHSAAGTEFSGRVRGGGYALSNDFAELVVLGNAPHEDAHACPRRPGGSLACA